MARLLVWGGKLENYISAEIEFYHANCETLKKIWELGSCEMSPFSNTFDIFIIIEKHRTTEGLVKFANHLNLQVFFLMANMEL